MADKSYSDIIDKLYLFLDAKSGKWKYRRRVPEDVRHMDGRREIKKSTKKKDFAEAVIVAREINLAAEQFWMDLKDGKAETTADDRYEKAVERARQLGFSYRRLEDMVAADDIRELHDRLLTLDRTGQLKSPTSVRAVLGTVDPPEITLSQLAETYIAISEDKQLHQRPDQNRRWQSQHRLAVSKAIAVIGDLPLTSIGPDQVLEIRDSFISQVASGTVRAATVNKTLGQLVTMWNDVNLKKRLKLQPVFAGMKLANAEDGKRQPFDPDYVASTLLGPTALIGLNAECRAVVALCASTGIRPIEFAMMPSANIILDHAVPHIHIQAEDNSRKAAAEAGLKVAHTARMIPLVGSAIAAAEAFPNGLVKYHGKPQALTSTIGKYLRENALLPSSDHSLYSLRHTFKDRLRAVQCPEEMTDALMGHKSHKPAYGQGYPLEVLREWVEQVAFDAPDWLR